LRPDISSAKKKFFASLRRLAAAPRPFSRRVFSADKKKAVRAEARPGGSLPPRAGNAAGKVVIPRDQVTLFGLSYCPYCKATQKFLARRLAAFTYFEADTLEGEAAADAFAAGSALNPALSFPVIVFADTGQILVGYDTIMLSEKLELALARYPELHKTPEEPQKRGPLHILKRRANAALAGRGKTDKI
jgi:glutaredoxin